jgi:hypothetical protein
VQDALLAKIKETGESTFTTPELADIDYFAMRAQQTKLENPGRKIQEGQIESINGSVNELQE